jgi:hypothetical protein
MKIITTARFFFRITNYQSFWNNNVHLYGFFPSNVISNKVQNIAKYRVLLLEKKCMNVEWYGLL